MSPPDSDRMVGTGGYHTRTSDAKCRVQGGVYLQDGRTQRQNFAQNGSQKLFCPGPEASDLVTKISTGMSGGSEGCFMTSRYKRWFRSRITGILVVIYGDL